MKKYFHQIKEGSKERRGSMAIEIIIGCMCFLFIMAFFMDITVLGWRFSVISQTNSFVARTVGLQGGLLNSAPSGFPGGDAAYISTSEMKSIVADNFSSAGIADGEYTITLNGVNYGSGLSVDYRDPIKIETKVEYSWTNVSSFIPGSLDNWITSKRSVVSEFKYRYDTWYGE